MPISKLVITWLVLSYVFLCTVSLTMPIWGMELFSDIAEPLPQETIFITLPHALPTAKPDLFHCHQCDGLGFKTNNTDTVMSASTQTSAPKSSKIDLK
jgi:hypothetical protein